MLTPDDIAARTDRAVAAASAAGRALGIRFDEPRVLYDVFSVIVHLAPAPVVVRVPTVLPRSLAADPDRQATQQRSELAVAGWLADHGHPVVPPSPLVAREPVQRDGFSMTFWRYLDELPDAEPDWPRRFAATARLHAALRDCDAAELGFWTQFSTYIPEGLAELERRPDLLDTADVARAQREWADIAPVFASRAAFEREFPGVDVQPIHGDAPFYNMIATPSGEYWSDFELVTLGAVESDLALAGAEGVAAYDAAAARLGMRKLDERVLALTEAAGRLAAVAVLALAPQLPMLADALRPTVDEWRSRPRD
ncbi:aminoglycoside phosphotransferase family protein [Mycobacterium sp. NPDC050551]|uniref:aminoglycoside phosphotransferase family protein n=1 Tax=Mycobacterium sp. NPDC050551 TaxID=3155407 RepID=UPI003431C222